MIEIPNLEELKRILELKSRVAIMINNLMTGFKSNNEITDAGFDERVYRMLIEKIVDFEMDNLP